MHPIFAILVMALTLVCLFQLKDISVTASNASDSPNSPTIYTSQKRIMIPSSSSCRTGKTSTEINAWRWSPNSRVQLFFMRGHFNDSEMTAMTQAVQGWNDALREINSDITFSLAGMTDQITKTPNTVIVKRVQGFETRRLAEIQPFYSSSTNSLVRAEINVGPTIKDLKVFTSMMNHELGHSLGLSDCPGCEKGSTAMASFRGKNKDNKLYTPSRCDKYVVATSYFINNFETTNALLSQIK